MAKILLFFKPQKLFERIHNNLNIAFPEHHEEANQKLLEENLVRSAFDPLALILYPNRETNPFWMSWDGDFQESLRDIEAGKSVIVLTAHNLPLCYIMASLHKIYTNYYGVEAGVVSIDVQAFVDYLRSKLNPYTPPKIYHRINVKDILTKNRVFIWAADQRPVDLQASSNVNVRFFGHEIPVYGLPFKLSLSKNIPVYCAHWQPQEQYSIEKCRVSLHKLNFASIEEGAQQYFSYIQKAIQADKASYFWLHNRFKVMDTSEKNFQI